MCGIAGYLGVERPGLGASMAGLLRHRGPDEAGEVVLPCADGRACVLAHQRLSIIDIPGGHQPQKSEDGSVQLIFNGEIYNFRALRAELEAKGHRFSTRSDTEVIVHLYEEHGDDCVQHLRGMFAFALWDAKRERLLLARDRLGVKPLYYALPDHGDIHIAFASELKSVLEVPGVSRELDLESLASYLAYLYIPHPQTAVRGARRLPPAHLLVAEGGRVRDPTLLVAGRGDRPRAGSRAALGAPRGGGGAPAGRRRPGRRVPLRRHRLEHDRGRDGRARRHARDVHRRLPARGGAALRRARRRERRRGDVRDPASRARGARRRARAAAGDRQALRRAVRQPDGAARLRALPPDATAREGGAGRRRGRRALRGLPALPRHRRRVVVPARARAGARARRGRGAGSPGVDAWPARSTPRT